MLIEEYTEYLISDIRLKLIKSKLDDEEIITRESKILDRRRYYFNNTDTQKILQYELFELDDEPHYVMMTVRRQVLDEVISFD